MDLATIRTVLRRYLNETTSQAWTDAELLLYINQGYWQICKEITKIDPMAFRATELHNLVANTTDYTLTIPPQSALGVMLVERMGAGSTSYTKQERKDLDVIRQWLLEGTLSGGGQPGTDYGAYAVSGQDVIVLAPAPSAASTNGLRITYRPVQSLSGGTDEPNIPEPLHFGIIYAAQMAAIGETYAETPRIEKRLNEIIADISFYWSRDDGEPLSFRPSGISGGERSIPSSLIGNNR